LSSYQIPSSAISIPSNFIFFKSLCGGERPNRVIDTKSQVIDMLYSAGLTATQAFVSNFNLRTGIFITGCMACGGGNLVPRLFPLVEERPWLGLVTCYTEI
jgi:hypothetical protein